MIDADSEINILDEYQNEIRAKMIKCGNMWQCTDCDYSSCKTTNLFRHIESKHVETRMYGCQYCGKQFKGVNVYQTHIYTVHKKSSL